MKPERNKFVPGFCLCCYTETQVIRFNKKPTCAKCLIGVDEPLDLEDFACANKSGSGYTRGEFVGASRSGEIPV
jgi:hypothetical protein